MTKREAIISELRNLPLDRAAIRQMRIDIADIMEDEKQKELPEEKREALERERMQLMSCMVATSNHISRIENLLAQLTTEEQLVLERMIVRHCVGVAFDLAEELHCETSRIYRIRARALSRLIRLRYGAGE